MTRFEIENLLKAFVLDSFPTFKEQSKKNFLKGYYIAFAVIVFFFALF
jgi:hypothetical protein